MNLKLYLWGYFDMSEKEFPTFVPNPPVGCIPNPNIPAVPYGYSVEEQILALDKKVLCMAGTYNKVMAECYKLLRNMQKAAEENGAYYNKDAVWTEEKFDAESSAIYTLTHINKYDAKNNPINFKLRLAYDNYENKNLKEDMFEASKATSADKMIVAQYQSGAGWYGLNFVDGCKLPTTINESLYTLGFTNERELKLYQNSIGYEQLVNDGIVNSMGVAGILIQDGAITATEYINKIPQYNVKTSRVAIGQNGKTGEIVVLSTGKEDDPNKQGMTTSSVASALLSAGCTIATELCEGDNSEMMNKGAFNYVPADNVVPSAVAYWYISRDEFYVNDCQYEIADLTQDYAKALWTNYLNALKIEQEIEDRKTADENLQNQIDDLENTFSTFEPRIKTLETNVSSLTSRMTAVETKNTQQDTEIAKKLNKSGDTMSGVLNMGNNKITALSNGTASTDAVNYGQLSTTNTNLSSLTTRVTAAETKLTQQGTAITTLQNNEAKWLDKTTGGTVNGDVIIAGGSNGNLELQSNGSNNNQPQITSTGESLTFEVATGDIIVKDMSQSDSKGMVTNLRTPTNDYDAANKAYVDAHSGGGQPSFPYFWWAQYWQASHFAKVMFSDGILSITIGNTTEINTSSYTFTSLCENVLDGTVCERIKTWWTTRFPAITTSKLVFTGFCGTNTPYKISSETTAETIEVGSITLEIYFDTNTCAFRPSPAEEFTHIGNGVMIFGTPSQTNPYEAAIVR